MRWTGAASTFTPLVSPTQPPIKSAACYFRETKWSERDSSYLLPNSSECYLQTLLNAFYVYGSANRWSILIIVQRNATQSSLFIILQVHSTCFGCQPHPSSGVHKTSPTAFGTGHIFCAAATLEGGSCTKNMTSTEGCRWSFVYSGWWVWLTPETCRVNLQNNK